MIGAWAFVQLTHDTASACQVFYAWKACWAENAQRKRILAHKALAPLVPGISQRDVFAAWHRVVLLSRCAKIQQNCQSNARCGDIVEAPNYGSQASPVRCDLTTPDVDVAPQKLGERPGIA